MNLPTHHRLLTRIRTDTTTARTRQSAHPLTTPLYPPIHVYNSKDKTIHPHAHHLLYPPCTYTTHSKDKIVPRTEMEKRMGEALSNKNWGASSTLMNQISADTFD